MGNAPDKTIDKGFMLQTQKLMNNFSRDEPLFHVEDIKFPLSTDEMKIVDATGRRVKLAGGNWSGGHMCRHCVDGLECRPIKEIAMDIRFKFKMNCIRLTYSLQLIFDNNIVPQKYLKANPDLQGKTSMEIFDITVKTLTDVGLMVILNNHTSTSQWCCSNDDGDGLWWSRQYPEYMFFQHVEDFSKRYKDNPRVIGMDMRNQIRKANGLDPTWGDGNPRTDWKRAAERSAQIALKNAPHWLILIGGINYQLDLTGVKESPITLSVPNKLVYTGHFYGFSWPIPSWSVYTYQNFKKRLFNTQTYVRSLGFPYLLGEYGNNNQDIPWKYLMQYLKQTDIDWTYWALDGFKCDPQKDQTYGVFTNDFSGARHPQMLEDMIEVGPPKSAKANYFSYLPGKNLKYQQSEINIEEPLVSNYEKLSNASNQRVMLRGERVTPKNEQMLSAPQKQYKISSKMSRPTEQEDSLSEKKKKYFDQMNQQAKKISGKQTQPTQQTPKESSQQTSNQQYNYYQGSSGQNYQQSPPSQQHSYGNYQQTSSYSASHSNDPNNVQFITGGQQSYSQNQVSFTNPTNGQNTSSQQNYGNYSNQR